MSRVFWPTMVRWYPSDAAQPWEAAGHRCRPGVRGPQAHSLPDGHQRRESEVNRKGQVLRNLSWVPLPLVEAQNGPNFQGRTVAVETNIQCPCIHGAAALEPGFACWRVAGTFTGFGDLDRDMRPCPGLSKMGGTYTSMLPNHHFHDPRRAIGLRRTQVARAVRLRQGQRRLAVDASELFAQDPSNVTYGTRHANQFRVVASHPRDDADQLRLGTTCLL